MMTRATYMVAMVAATASACGLHPIGCQGGNDPSGGPNVSASGHSTEGGGGTTGTGTVNPPDITPSTDPVSPPDSGTAKPVQAPNGITLPAAPEFKEAIKFSPNRSSVVLYLPAVQGARDYRAFALVNGVKVELAPSGGEDVSGATITCAGLRQHAACDDSEAITEYGQGEFFIPKCKADARAAVVTKTVVRTIEVNKLEGATALAVEAIDAQCPFPGLCGRSNVDVRIDHINGNTRPATVNGRVVQMPFWPDTFPIRTEADIRAKYKSMIVNGQGWIPRSANVADPPFLGYAQQAPPISPKVLARAIVEVTPSGTKSLPPGFTANDVFDDFSDDNDQPKLILAQGDSGPRLFPPGWPVGNAKHYQNSKWNIYTMGADPAQMFVGQGQMNLILADTAQGVFSSNLVMPKRPMHLPGDDKSFLHVTFETQTDASPRRYFVLQFCGAAQPGKTYDGDKLPLESAFSPGPGFMNPSEATQLSSKGWNCIHLVPRDGGYDTLAGGSLNGSTKPTRPETDIRVVLNRPTPDGVDPRNDRDVAKLLGPAQYPGQDQAFDGAWYRTWGNDKKINGVMLDDQMFITQRTKFDVFLNRGRIVMYANGVQKICNDIPTAQRLTMADVAVAIGHVLYHSNVEAMDFNRADWNRTAQYHFRHNTPFADARSLDNVGMRENAQLPAGFQEGPCYRP